MEFENEISVINHAYNISIEEYSVLPDSECSSNSGMKAVFWADDDCDNGHAIYQDTIPCGQFI